MRTLTTLLAVAVFVLPVAAQQALNEQFNFSTTATFPPQGWVEVNNNFGPNMGWEETSVNIVSLNSLGIDAAGHDDYDFGVTNDFSLITPMIELIGFDQPKIVFDQSLGYAEYMANHPASLGDGMSTIEASLDGGVTWMEMWTETRTNDGPYYEVTVDLDMFSNVDRVQFAFHYFGTYAHTWVIDNVVIESEPFPQPVLPTLSCWCICPGYAYLTVSNMTPGGQVYIGWSPFPGQYMIPSGPCAGVMLDLFKPTLQFTRIADANGVAVVKRQLPAAACGMVYALGFDVATCTPTNSVLL